MREYRSALAARNTAAPQRVREGKGQVECSFGKRTENRGKRPTAASQGKSTGRCRTGGIQDSIQDSGARAVSGDLDPS